MNLLINYSSSLWLVTLYCVG